MRIYLTILMIVAATALAQAQRTDTAVYMPDTLLTQYEDGFDSIQNIKNNAIDSLDNLNKKGNARLQKVKTFNVKEALSPDTLTSRKVKPIARIDSATANINAKIDSITHINLPSQALNKAFDSLNRYDPTQKLQEVESKMAETQHNLNKKLSKPADKVNDKLNLLSKESEGYGNLPSGINTPAIDQLQNLPENPNLGLHAPELPNQSMNNPLEKADLGTDFKLGNKTDVIPDAEKITEGLDGVSKISGNISGYAEDAKNIGSGNFDDVKQIDNHLVSRLPGDLQAAQTGLGTAQEQLAALKAMNNKEAFKKQVLEKSREVVARQLASHQSQVSESVNKLSKHQKRAGTLFSKVKDMPKAPRKERKPPVIERILPGLTLQVQRSNNWFIDLNPSVQYRIRSIFTAGAGWNERIVFDSDFNFYKKSRVYGFRTFYELKVLKGLWLRADVERMNTFVPADKSRVDQGTRKPVWSYMAGLKKDFTFSPGVIGNVQFLYNIYDPDKISPYFNRINVRFGFAFPVKKKKT